MVKKNIDLFCLSLYWVLNLIKYFMSTEKDHGAQLNTDLEQPFIGETEGVSKIFIFNLSPI